MTQVRLTYDDMDASDLHRLVALRGTDPLIPAEIVVGLDADFQLVDAGAVIYEDPTFPVVELAVSLHRWLAGDEHDEFLFDSMSIEERGAVFVSHREGGWVFGSVFAPGLFTRPISWPEVQACVQALEQLVRQDLARLNIDPDWLFS